MNAFKLLPQIKQRKAVKLRHIVMLIYPQAELLDITGPLDIFAGAARLLPQTENGEPAYKVEIVAESRGPIETSSGIKLMVEQSYQDLNVDNINTVMIAGGLGFEAALKQPELLAWISEKAISVRRLASICTGSFLLAETGILDGRRATTHWAFAKLLAHCYPKVVVEDDALFIRDGHLYTSAGITAGMDLALSMVEEDYGRETALTVARAFVMFLKRPGGQSQYSVQLAMQYSGNPLMRKLQDWIIDNLSVDLSIERLAARVSMSPRNFARVFKTELQISPAAFVEKARLEAARLSLEDTELSINAISMAYGFKSPDRMRRAFIRQLGVSPQDYRKRFQADPTPE